MNTNDLVRRLDVAPRQINFWVGQGYIKPMSGGGTGNRFEFSSSEFLVIERMVKLVNAGVLPKVAAMAARGDSDIIQLLRNAVEECIAKNGEALF